MNGVWLIWGDRQTSRISYIPLPSVATGSTAYISPPLPTMEFSPSVILMGLMNTWDGCGLLRLSVVYDPLLIALLGFGFVLPVATETDNLFVPRSRPLL